MSYSLCYQRCHYNVVEKYDYVGKLLRPGEQATDYELEEEERAGAETTAAGGDNKKSN